MAVPRLGGSCHAPRTRSEPSAEPPANSIGPRGQERGDTQEWGDTVTIALTSESVATPAALSDGDQMLIVELGEGDPGRVALVREAEDSVVEGGMVAAGRGRKGKRAEYRCATCGYGIVVYGQAPSCPMCSEARWEHVEWRPFSQLLGDVAVPSGSRSQAA
jgi:hypothetical protein